VVRTQIYLTEEEREGLAILSEASGKKQSELIRETLDRFLGQFDRSRKFAVLDAAAGIWKDRRDLPDLGAVRKEWDRSRGR
jgi:hypothetical protein